MLAINVSLILINKDIAAIRCSLTKATLCNYWISPPVAKYEAFPKLAPRISKKRLDIFLKDLGAVNASLNLHDSLQVKPCDLGNHSLGPDRKQPPVTTDFKPLNNAFVCHVSLSQPYRDSSNINTSGQIE